MSSMLTVDQLAKVLPNRLKAQVTSSLVDKINKIAGDTSFKEAYRDNLLSYTSVMQDSRFGIEAYINAVKYVSHKLSGDSNINAYVKTFPDRYQSYLNNNQPSKDIASNVTSYNKTKLVNLIYEQTLVPSYILNADMFQEALNTQADLMINARSEKVRCDAANSLLSHLKVPEAQKLELDISVKEDKAINELRSSTMELVAMQRKMIESGMMNTQEVAHSKLLIDVTPEDGDDGSAAEGV